MNNLDYRKIVQSLVYFSKLNNGTMNIMKAIKLIWLSDRLHLRKYGRLITGDSYVALKLGPVPSITTNILKQYQLDDETANYINQYIAKVGQYDFKYVNEIDIKKFSESDIEIFNIIFDNFNKYNHFELSDFSHKFPEWLKFENELNENPKKSFPIEILDFFKSVDEESKLFVENEMLALSKEIHLEQSEYESIFL